MAAYGPTMTYRARVRIEMEDRPGSLAGVAEAIAGRGGNVVAIDVQEVDDHHVCDELVVDLPDAVGEAELAAALVGVGASTTRPGASLLSLRPGDGKVDPVIRSLRWACAVIGGGSAAEDELTRAIADVCGTPAAWVLDSVGSRMFEAGRLALDRGRPVARRTADVPARLAAGSADEWWLLAVPDGRLDPRRVAFVARPVSLRFNATEIARVEALLGFLRLVETSGAGAPPYVAGSMAGMA